MTIESELMKSWTEPNVTLEPKKTNLFYLAKVYQHYYVLEPSSLGMSELLSWESPSHHQSLQRKMCSEYIKKLA